MTTTVTAASKWSGSAFHIKGDDIPHWIIQAMGAGNFVIGEDLTVTTPAGPVVANPTDWVFLTQPAGVEGEDGYVPPGLGVATDEDFTTNYEVYIP
jgi:hypothetical protein